MASEHAFDPVLKPRKEHDHGQVVALGLQRMSASIVYICGLARSVALLLPTLIARIEHLGSMFRSYKVLIVENDSCDTTPEQLNQWAISNTKVQVISFEAGLPHYPSIVSTARTCQLAALRNLCLSWAETEKPDFLIMLDTDLEGGWSYEGIAHTFGCDSWDAVGSNGLFFFRAVFRNKLRRYCKYYDSWALRKAFRRTSLSLGHYLPYKRGTSLVPCHSCFGGLAVYRYTSIVGCSYSGNDCEHVGLHKQMRARGCDKIFVNPNQITEYNERKPVVTCVLLSGNADLSGIEVTIEDFHRQTYPQCELIICTTNPKLRNQYRASLASRHRGKQITIIHVADNSIKTGYKALFALPLGSIVCQWGLHTRVHPSRLEEQFKHMCESPVAASLITGALRYYPHVNELYWYNYAGIGKAKSGYVPAAATSVMTYRHAFVRTITELLSGFAELCLAQECVMPHGGGWLMLKTGFTDDLPQSSAMNRDALNRNVQLIRSAARVYGLQSPLRIMGSDGLAYTL